jgi:hypothetical protein
MMIEKIFPTSPIDVLYKSDLFLQKWRILLREDGKGKLEVTRDSAGPRILEALR